MNQQEYLAIRSVFAAMRQLSNGDFDIAFGDGGESTFARHAKHLLSELANCLSDWQNEKLKSPIGYADMILAVILNSQGFVVDLNTTTNSIWGYNAKDFQDAPFEKFLDKESAKKLSTAIRANIKSAEFVLTVRTHDGKFSTDHFSFSRLKASRHIILIATIPVFKNHVTDVIPDLAKSAHDYICNHLHERIPSSKKLARLLGANEFTLKQSFRLKYGTSLYHFYTRKRLEKAHELIARTDMQIKDVGITCGFRDYATFFKAFRKHFGYTQAKRCATHRKETECATQISQNETHRAPDSKNFTTQFFET